ncbi:hypothetical protein ACFPA1_09365 [Neobacillus sp. GCM10023253]|uniref:hypothetical protein n=1 Tax=Neobacillus sp. GCM10023253 TaxID=3252644 RepID=UPI00360E7F2D
MNLLDYKFTWRYGIKAKFDRFPGSTVIFRPIKGYYYVYTVDWSVMDPVVTKADLEKMGLLINIELGLEKGYLNRKSNTDRTPE